MRRLAILILLFLTGSLTFGQISYQGPVQGTSSAGKTVNTNNFLKASNSKSSRFRMFANQRIKDIPNPIEDNFAAAPEGTNLFLNNTSEKAPKPDNIILFTSFNGIDETNSIPPDPYVAVGANHIVQTVNTLFRISDKDGKNATTIAGDDFFRSVYPQVSVFDPKISYDQFSNRWIMVWLHQDDDAAEGEFLLSVSDDDDPNGIWYIWALPSNVYGNTQSGSWGDYQGVGYDDKAIYFTSNQFTYAGSYQGSRLRIIPKEQLYNSTTPGTVTYSDIYNITYPVGSGSAFSLRPARMMTADDNFYFAVHSPYTTKNNFGIYKLANPLTNPVLTGVAVPVTAYYTPTDPDQLGGGSPAIDGGGANLRNEPVFKDGFIHLTHATRVGAYSGIRYLAINTGTNSAIVDMVVGDPNSYHTYPAVAVTEDDDVVLVYSKSSSSTYMGAYYTIIPSSTLVPSESIELQPGYGNYVKTFSGSRNRWGDYSGAWTDPSDPSNIFIFGEYVAETNTWGCWLGGVRIKPYPNATAFFDKNEVDLGFREINIPSETFQVKILNYGEPQLSISNIQPSSSNFVIQNNLTYPITLNSFESIVLDVVFTPTEEKEYLDSLIVSSNDVDEPNKSIIIKSTGYLINKATENVFYATSGTSSLSKLISINPTNASATLIGEANIGKLNSLTVQKSTKELYTLVATSTNSKIARVDATTGNAVVYKDFGINFKAIAFDKNDTLYAISDDNKLYTIDIKNSSVNLKTDLSISVLAMAFDPSDNKLFATIDSTTGKDRIYTIDVTTGTSTLIGNTSINYIHSALSFDKNNELYGLALKAFQRGNLIKIDKNTGLGTELGNTTYTSTLGMTILADTTTSVEEELVNNPADFALIQNYPNPFNPSTTISFNLPVASKVKLTIYNVLGQQIKVLVNKDLAAGKHNIMFNANNELTSGMYMYSLEATGVNGKKFNQTKKMMLVK